MAPGIDKPKNRLKSLKKSHSNLVRWLLVRNSHKHRVEKALSRFFNCGAFFVFFSPQAAVRGRKLLFLLCERQYQPVVDFPSPGAMLRLLVMVDPMPGERWTMELSMGIVDKLTNR